MSNIQSFTISEVSRLLDISRGTIYMRMSGESKILIEDEDFIQPEHGSKTRRITIQGIKKLCKFYHIPVPDEIEKLELLHQGEKNKVEQEEFIQDLNQELSEVINILKEQLSEKDNQIKQKDKQIEQLNQQILEFHDRLKESSERLKEMNYKDVIKQERILEIASQEKNTFLGRVRSFFGKNL